MKHSGEASKKSNGFGRVGLLLRHADDVLEDGGDVLQFCNLPGGKNMKEGLECDHNGPLMILELLAARLESLDVPLLGRNDINHGDHLLGQNVNRSIQIDGMLRAFRRCPVLRSQGSRFISRVGRRRWGSRRLRSKPQRIAVCLY